MKKDQPRAKCVFCNIERKLSKEHILPEWLINNNVISKKQDYYFEHDIVFNNLGGIPKESEKIKKQGYLGNNKRRIVCIVCNGGWISQLQSDNQEVLTALIKGEEVNLDNYSRGLLYKWIVMTSIIVSFSSANRILTRKHANYFYESSYIFPNPIVYIGRYSGPHRIRRTNLCGYVGDEKLGVEVEQNIQFVSITLGKLFIQMAFCLDNAYQPYISRRFEPYLYLLYPPLQGSMNNFYKSSSIDHFTAKLIQERFQIEKSDPNEQAEIISEKLKDFLSMGD
jgi:hypothetical protein